MLVPVSYLLPPFDIIGEATNQLMAFIDSIPVDKVTGFTTIENTIHKDINFRLDMQSVRSMLWSVTLGA